MLATGTFLGNRYEIIELVGCGGMADVYKAKCHRLNRFVAIKVLKEEFGKDADFVKRFHVEAQSAAGLLHPNVVNIYDVGEEAGLHYIVMELAEGVTLQEYIRKNGKLSAEETVNLSIQIAQGIEAAHNNKTVHRDIKPQNIIITNDGRIKVTDFGIARASNVNTITTATMGSVHYFSPEQARGGYVDARSDIYSLGITMYEMLTGHVPFDGDNAVTVALKHLQDDVVFTEDEKNGVPKSLENIILKAVNKKPEFRYDTVTAMIADLHLALRNPDGSYVSSNKDTMVSGATIIMPKEDVEKIKSTRLGNNDRNNKIKKAEATKEETNDVVFRNTEEMNPKLEKIIMALTIVVGILFAAIFIGFIVKTVGNLNNGTNHEETTTQNTAQESTTNEVAETVPVPQVVNKLRDDAVAELEDLGLIVLVEEEISNDVEKDYVIRQSIPFGYDVEKGETITLIVSEGKDSVKVQDVLGKEETEAKKILMDDGFQVSTEEDYSSKYEEGTVMAQTPKGNKKAEYGSKVTLVISKGKKEIRMISVLGRTKDTAKTMLEEAGLKLGKVNKAYSDTYEEGTIISQEIQKDEIVEEGTKLNVVISLGSASENVTYKGKITVDCPFAEGIETGMVTMILSQSSKTKTIYENTVTRADFPLSIEFEGYVEGNAVVTVYVDGSEHDSYPVYLEKVTE